MGSSSKATWSKLTSGRARLLVLCCLGRTVRTFCTSQPHLRSTSYRWSLHTCICCVPLWTSLHQRPTGGLSSSVPPPHLSSLFGFDDSSRCSDPEFVVAPASSTAADLFFWFAGVMASLGPVIFAWGLG